MFARSYNWPRSRLLVAVMAVGSSSCSSLPALDLELEREMKIYIHDAVFILSKRKIFSKDLVSLPTGFWQISVLHLLPKVTFFTQLTTNLM